VRVGCRFILPDHVAVNLLFIELSHLAPLGCSQKQGYPSAVTTLA
jgi:hypothetical protein